MDPSGAFREGFDEMLDESAVLDLKLDQVEFSEDDDWDEDILAVSDEAIEGAAFSTPSTKPATVSKPPNPIQNEPIDLGFDELEMELDLEGGSLDGSVMLQQILEEEEGTPFVHSISTNDEWTPPIEPSKRPLMSTDSFVALQEDDLLTAREQPKTPRNLQESDFSDTAFDFNRNFSRNSQLEEVDDAPTELDLAHVRTLLKAGKLTDAAKYLARFPNEMEHLVDALNLTALHAYAGKHYRAADVLWKRALSIEPDPLNITFNYARLLVAMGRTDDARSRLNSFIERKPHFSPAHSLLKQLNS